MDLCAFLGHELSPLRLQRRVLVVEYKELFVGLLVDEVAGLKHFAQDTLEPGVGDFADTAINPYLQGQFRREQIWQVFSPFALARSPGFLEVAA